MDACLVLGKTSVVYPHNINGVVLDVSNRICGPHMSSVFGNIFGVSAMHNIAINLENCIIDGEGSEPSENMFQGRRCRFNFLALRALVRDTVVIANAILDMSIRDNVYGAGDSLCMYRPLHLSIVGFHSALGKMGLKYSDKESFVFNVQVSELIYYAAVRASVDLCMAGAEPFPKFKKSLYAAGRFYHDFYDVETRGPSTLPEGSWEKLREDVVKYGIRNSTFIAGGLSEELSNFAGTSHGFWPRGSNMTMEETPLLYAPSKEKYLKEAVDVADALKLDVAAIDDKSIVKFIKPRRITLPVINRHLLDIPKDIAIMALRIGYAAGLYTDSDDDSDLACLETGWTVSTDAVIKMCADRQPYVDQCQCLPIYIGPGRSAVELARHLRRANTLGFGIGIYKCLLSPRANYR